MKLKKILTMSVFSMAVVSCSYIKTADNSKKGSRGIASTDTPAQESVCDELTGATPGLYGLCVAYCEAQDGPEVIYDDLTLVEQNVSTPHRKILENYDKKRRDEDPRMPCVSYQTTCPVWSKEELEAIGSKGGFDLRDNQTVLSNGRENFYDYERGRGDVYMWYHYAQVLKNWRGMQLGDYVGRYRYSDPNTGEYIFRNMPLTEEEYNSCKQQLIDHKTRP
ncbi:MAG: hypothetical protein EP319_00690 [Deltaproteobacteria bacterium]|nr:MAG: hypothetical protein EP319_00690 [Deltaproteobacteria bacterium]